MNKRYCAPLRISGVEIIIQEPKEHSQTRAFANVTFNGLLVIKGFRIIEGQDNYYVAMPSFKRRDGSYANMIYTNQLWLKDLIEDVVMDAYAEKTGLRFEETGTEENS